MTDRREQFRKRNSQLRVSVPGTVMVAIWIGTFWLYQSVTSLDLILTVPLSFLTAFATGMMIQAVRDTWPAPVPLALAGHVARLTAGGWRKARVHPWWRYEKGECPEKVPHVHMVSPDGGPVVLRDLGVARDAFPADIFRLRREGWTVIRDVHPVHCHITSEHVHLRSPGGDVMIIARLDGGGGDPDLSETGAG